MSGFVQVGECRLARLILAEPDRYHATPVELRALRELTQAYAQKRECNPECLRIARHIMRSSE